MKKLLLRYKHLCPILIYMVIYLSWFFVLENKITTYRIIHTTFDDKIPFCEFFVIPYYIWFGYVAVCVLTAAFTDVDEYYKGIAFLMTGMTIFLIISTIWPNGHNLRPVVLPNDNFCSRLVERIYLTDTPTNLWPSIHVYNSIGAHLCLTRSNFSKKHGWVKYISFITAVLIILSTMFIKQHSVFDVFTAFLMSILMGIIVYRRDIQEYFPKRKNKHTIHVIMK